MIRIDYYPPLYKNNFYHIFNRGNGTEKIFYKAENYSYFFRQFQNYLKDLVEIYAFCLLPNHFHMMIKVLEGSPEMVSKHFRDFFISYSMAVNKQQNRKGNLFQKRFKRRWINNEEYLMRVIFYIHSNPVHHKICINFEEYKYSSYKLITQENKLVKCSEVLGWFGGLTRFKDFHKIDIPGILNDNYVIE